MSKKGCSTIEMQAVYSSRVNLKTINYFKKIIKFTKSKDISKIKLKYLLDYMDLTMY